MGIVNCNMEILIFLCVLSYFHGCLFRKAIATPQKLLCGDALVNPGLLIPRNYFNKKTALHVQVSLGLFINKTQGVIYGENKLYPTVQYKAVFLSRVSRGDINHRSKAQVVCTCHQNPEIKIWPYNMYSLGVFYYFFISLMHAATKSRRQQTSTLTFPTFASLGGGFFQVFGVFQGCDFVFVGTGFGAGKRLSQGNSQLWE